MAEDSPTIFLPRGCKPTKTCANQLDNLPWLEHGLLVRRDDGLWLVTSNNVVASAIRVGGDAKPGWIHHGAIKLLEKGYRLVQMSRTAWRYDTYNEQITFDCAKAVRNQDAAAEKLVGKLVTAGLWDPPESAGDLIDSDGYAVVGLDHALLACVGQALGAMSGVRLRLAGRLRAVHVTPLPEGMRGRVGAVMPIRLEEDRLKEDVDRG